MRQERVYQISLNMGVGVNWTTVHLQIKNWQYELARWSYFRRGHL
jgi:hypothetical protein